MNISHWKVELMPGRRKGLLISQIVRLVLGSYSQCPKICKIKLEIREKMNQILGQGYDERKYA